MPIFLYQIFFKKNYTYPKIVIMKLLIYLSFILKDFLNILVMDNQNVTST